MGNTHNQQQSHVKSGKVTQTSVDRVLAVSTLHAPAHIKTKDEFGRSWFTWKEQFLKYSRNYKIETGRNASVDTLLNSLGPVGQEIWQTFTFVEPKDKEDLNGVLRKFDMCCAFGTRKKQPTEHACRYINDLKTIAERYFSDIEEIVRDKVFIELYEHCIKNHDEKGQMLLFLPKYMKLSLTEIAYGWQFYENDFLKKQRYKGTDMIADCKDCGNDHFPNACPAQGKLCMRCKELNHFNNRCPKIFITNCKYYGSNHAIRQCPAYNQTCSNCNKLHHFSWKCAQSTILNCRNCSLSHIAKRSECPAEYTYCTNCKTVGHFPSKCRKNRR